MPKQKKSKKESIVKSKINSFPKKLSLADTSSKNTKDSKIQPVSNKEKKEIILIRRNKPVEETRGDFEGEFELESPNNRVRIKMPRPFLEQRQIASLEEDLEDVPATKKDNETASVNYSNIKSGYAVNAPLYTAGGNAPQYSAQEFQTTPQDFSAGMLGNPASGTQMMDIKKWQQSNMSLTPQQQEAYKISPAEKVEEKRDLPFQRRKEGFL